MASAPSRWVISCCTLQWLQAVGKAAMELATRVGLLASTGPVFLSESKAAAFPTLSVAGLVAFSSGQIPCFSL
jgi:hypothetical protein